MTKSPRPKPLLTGNEPLRSNPRKPRDPSQPQLPFDTMPTRVEPCLALVKQRAPVGAEWLYEIKWDGYRIAVHLDNGNVRILTRGGHDWTYRFPAIEAAAKSLGVGTAIIDGEAVVLDEQGRPHFGMLQNSLGGRGGKLPSGQAMMMAFDLLYFDGHDIRNMELSSRRFFLESLLRSEQGAIRLSEAIDGDGREIFAVACEQGLEGIIAKHRDSSYRSGRLGDWIKVKCLQSDSFIVVGYEQSSVARAGIGSLLLAARKGHEWVYVGNVGTGFTESNAESLRNTLDRITAKRPPVEYDGRRRNVVWVQPTLIAEIEYRAWTHDRKLRHAAYKGLREVQDNAAIYEIE
ncbi:bifunctional non-homologous end joining protein LigD [Rhizobium tibeticum]|uniref:DNA ligase (ATP) n=1 Tax=Rhizobium tibeticum TaxID=501024 RepID=A0A1H8UP89_9HYPH|nr:non-homologous end-joining DNA ligase [Rhizobium tibeticum]SEI17726.1 putative DNA ligase-like protein/MT0965 [Rhizobium tibeticum]SEP05019.1 bifunctional non-homologous end joining protein LigD [Rhizobium tibeticum]